MIFQNCKNHATSIETLENLISLFQAWPFCVHDVNFDHFQPCGHPWATLLSITRSVAHFRKSLRSDWSKNKLTAPPFCTQVSFYDPVSDCN